MDRDRLVNLAVTSFLASVWAGLKTKPINPTSNIGE